MPDPEIENKVKQIIVDELGVDENEVTPNARFIDDLGADSLDTVELVMSASHRLRAWPGFRRRWRGFEGSTRLAA